MRLTSGVKETMTTDIATPFAVEENNRCAGFLQSHQAPQGCDTEEQAEELSVHLKQKRERTRERDQVNPVLQWSQRSAETLSLGKAAEGGFGNLAWVAQTP